MNNKVYLFLALILASPVVAMDNAETAQRDRLRKTLLIQLHNQAEAAKKAQQDRLFNSFRRIVAPSLEGQSSCLKLANFVQGVFLGIFTVTLMKLYGLL